ncbi:response regulator [Mucilaginibacter boryungensis]|uniref:Response regulator n=1 Tax=Mucilaginibacter boryungensis TaxID=768480 RepID=A0ABR9XDY2_9SPHI|nr:response regulator [Mucilaginibacter boryungensis]MBE9665607.1 response regulator [Mucilaginibacter boryungensis]
MLKRILVLDDNQDILEVVNEVLAYENFDVHATSNSEGIIAVTEAYNPDLIILDYRLNNANGGEICHELKSHPKFKHIPVIIFSAYINLSIDYAKYGCDAVISKPFDLSQLIETVNGLITKV